MLKSLTSHGRHKSSKQAAVKESRVGEPKTTNMNLLSALPFDECPDAEWRKTKCSGASFFSRTSTTNERQHATNEQAYLLEIFGILFRLDHLLGGTTTINRPMFYYKFAEKADKGWYEDLDGYSSDVRGTNDSTANKILQLVPTLSFQGSRLQWLEATRVHHVWSIRHADCDSYRHSWKHDQRLKAVVQSFQSSLVPTTRSAKGAKRMHQKWFMMRVETVLGGLIATFQHPLAEDTNAVVAAFWWSRSNHLFSSRHGQ